MEEGLQARRAFIERATDLAVSMARDLGGFENWPISAILRDIPHHLEHMKNERIDGHPGRAADAAAMAAKMSLVLATKLMLEANEYARFMGEQR